MTHTEVASDTRKAEFPIHEVFLTRWSPRALSGEPVARDELFRLFEAARWAPSSYNNQPWRFVYALRDTPFWEAFFQLLTEGNRKWASQAGALIIIVSKTTFDRDGRPARTHVFDTGAAWENLALQAAADGLVARGMQGFDYDGAARLLGLSDEYAVQAMVAVGHPGADGSLPAPSTRKPLDSIAFEGSLPSPST